MRAANKTIMIGTISFLLTACGSGYVKESSNLGLASAPNKPTQSNTSTKPQKYDPNVPTNPVKPKPVEAPRTVELSPQKRIELKIAHNTTLISSERRLSKSYLKSNPELPATHTVTHYSANLDQADSVKAGNNVNLVSTIEVLSSKTNKKPVIEEKFELIRGGKILNSSKRRINKAPPSGGIFQSRYTIMLPNEIKSGQYELNTALIIDSKEVKTSTQIVSVSQ